MALKNIKIKTYMEVVHLAMLKQAHLGISQTWEVVYLEMDRLMLKDNNHPNLVEDRLEEGFKVPLLQTSLTQILLTFQMLQAHKLHRFLIRLKKKYLKTRINVQYAIKIFKVVKRG